MLQRLITRDNHSGQQANAHALAVMLERTATMMGRYQMQRAMERIPPGIEAHIIRPTNSMGEATLDFDHAANWIDTAYEFARDYLREHVRPLSSAVRPVEALLPDAEELAVTGVDEDRRAG